MICQAVARALTTNFNVAFRNGLQCIGALCDGKLIAARSASAQRMRVAMQGP